MRIYLVDEASDLEALAVDETSIMLPEGSVIKVETEDLVSSDT